MWQREWAAGTKQWTPVSLWWLQPRLHREGTFYMTFEDFLETFETIERVTILDDAEWTSRQKWVKMDVSWMPTYNNTFFVIHLTRRSRIAFVLSKLDNDYFRGLEGQFYFHLQFVVRDGEGQVMEHARAPSRPDEDGIARRSVALETELSAGHYQVLVKITATSDEVFRKDPCSVEDVVKQNIKSAAKLQQIARNYDVAWQKLEIIEDPSRDGENHEGGEIAGDAGEKASTDLEEKTKGAKEPAKDAKEETTKSETEKDQDKKIYSVHQKPHEVAWNAVCGVGLRVYSKDPDMRLELRHRKGDPLRAADSETSSLTK